MAQTTTPTKPAVASGQLINQTVIGELTTKLIGSVSVQPSTVRPGQSVLVEVLDANGRSYAANSPVAVTINGVPAARRYLQFIGAGNRTLQVRAVLGSNSEAATATVTVAGDPLTFRRTLTPPEITPIAKLALKQAFTNHYVATFTLGTPVPTPRIAKATAATPAAGAQKRAAVPLPKSSLDVALDALPAGQLVVSAPESRTARSGMASTGSFTVANPPSNINVTPQKTSYTWDFGDGTTITTQAPSVSHDYFPAIEAGRISHAFDVTCTVEHDNLSVTRTLVLNSAYGLCKRFGTIVPHVESDVFATWHKNVGFSASMTVHNIESGPITLTSMGFAPTSDDPDAQLPAPKFTTMKTPITIKAKSASAFGILIPISELASATKLGNAVPGFMVYYRGTYSESGKTTPVLFSRTIRVPLTQSGGAWLTQANAIATKPAVDWSAVNRAALAVATDAKLRIAADASAIVADEATQTFAIALASPPHDIASKAQARAAIQSGLISAAGGKGA